MSYDVTITTGVELVILQTLSQLLMVINLSVHLPTKPTIENFQLQKYHKSHNDSMDVVLEAYRDNNGLVLVKERLITGIRIDDSKTLMGQVIEPVLIYSAPIRSSVPQSIAKIFFLKIY